MPRRKTPPSQQRFYEGTGVRFMKDGISVRCQGRSKGRLLKLFPGDPEDKVAFNAWLRSLPDNAYWPETQCSKRAEENAFLCWKHGGNSPGAKKTNPVDFLPGEMAEKIAIMRGNTNILNRSFEIHQLMARNLVLYDRMRTNALTGNQRALIMRGLAKIEAGKIKEGREEIIDVLQALDTEAAYFEEIRANMKMLGDLTSTQVKTAQVMQQMVTTDQYLSTLYAISDIFLDVVGEFIHDPALAEQLISAAQSRIGRLINARSTAVLRAPGEET